MTKKQKYQVHIKWDLKSGGSQVKTYSFDTIEEREAFHEGVYQAHDKADYQIVREGGA